MSMVESMNRSFYRDNENVLQALEYIDSSDYNDWIKIGMALKNSGIPCSVWEDWSRFCKKFKEGKCEEKWKTFNREDGNMVRAGTIIKMAQERGFKLYEDTPLDWDSEIDDDYTPKLTRPAPPTPVQTAITFLETLYKPDDIVGYTANKNDILLSDGKYRPATNGRFDRTAGELIAELKAHPDDIAAAIGGYNENCGGWIRMNPMDGQGGKDENVVAFRYALVECDDIPIKEQEEKYLKYNLPIATLVYSGGKSVHAVVRIDAKDAKEYEDRVKFLYDYLKENGVPVDGNNKNPSRSTRLPGLKRGDKMQELLGINLGKASWDEWYDFVTGVDDDFFEIVESPDEYEDIQLAEELIKSITRKGQKMMFSGDSKGGKTFGLIELAVCIVNGKKWLGNFSCVSGNVLYINLEVMESSFRKRVQEVQKAMGIHDPVKFDICNLRGKWKKKEPLTLEALVPTIERKCRYKHYDAVIVDPIYKVNGGSENDADSIKKLCDAIDRIAETGATVIFVHHHTKGAQSSKKAMDRGSGSSVFARDVDTLVDMTELQVPEEMEDYDKKRDGIPCRLEFVLRDFEPIDPVNVWFKYPIHLPDTTGILKRAKIYDPSKYNPKQDNPYNDPWEEKKEQFDKAFNSCIPEEDGSVLLNNIVPMIGRNITPETVKTWVKRFNDDYVFVPGKRGTPAKIYERVPFEEEKKKQEEILKEEEKEKKAGKKKKNK